MSVLTAIKNLISPPPAALDVHKFDQFDYVPAGWHCEPFRDDVTGEIIDPWAPEPAIPCLAEFSIGKGYVIGHHRDDGKCFLSLGGAPDHFLISDTPGGWCRFQKTKEGGVACKSNNAGYFRLFHVVADPDFTDSEALKVLRKAAGSGRAVSLEGAAVPVTILDEKIRHIAFRGFDGSNSCPVVGIVNAALHAPTPHPHQVRRYAAAIP